uniref:G_PROTEIN_RECEP_F1_2 domain-containing protein n=1 Tax=Ascaris lumbricoides TaxID=6252 RepID=A0A0M3I1S2_ASCLU
MSIPQSSLNGGGMFKVATRAEMGQVTSGSYFTEVPTANTTQKSLSVCEKTDDNRIMRMLPHRTLRHHWFCSQIHSLVGNRVVIFVAFQLVMLISSSAVFFCIGGAVPSCAFREPYKSELLLLATANFFSALLGFLGLRVSDRIHYRGSRLCETCAFPPVVLLIPSFMAQLADVLVLAYYITSNVHRQYINSDLTSMTFWKIFADVLLFTIVPLIFAWVILIYALLASFDVSFYVIRRSRKWHLRKPPPIMLTAHSSFKGISLESQSPQSLHHLSVKMPKNELSNGAYSDRNNYDSSSQTDRTRTGNWRIDALTMWYAGSVVCTLTSRHPRGHYWAEPAADTSLLTQVSVETPSFGVPLIRRRLDTILEESGNSHSSGDV